ncbi:hypothetical protein DVH05_025859 [Phytophthora capsici]|nr:hypothetical protein DVH05_025859 [Phytophthora capsici]
MSTGPRTVNAYASFGKDEEIKPWQYQSRPLGDEDIEIKISHCGICGSDLHTIESGWGPSTYCETVTLLSVRPSTSAVPVTIPSSIIRPSL